MSNLTGEEWQTGDRHIVMGGGESLPGAPESWDAAHAWEDKANEGKDDQGSRWSWDCHFKLDYDGPLLRISSRFYPPAKYYGTGWDGTVSLMMGDVTIIEKEFKEDDLDTLKAEVEAYCTTLGDKVKIALTGMTANKQTLFDD